MEGSQLFPGLPQRPRSPAGKRQLLERRRLFDKDCAKTVQPVPAECQNSGSIGPYFLSGSRVDLGREPGSTTEALPDTPGLCWWSQKFCSSKKEIRPATQFTVGPPCKRVSGTKNHAIVCRKSSRRNGAGGRPSSWSGERVFFIVTNQTRPKTGSQSHE